VTGTSYSTTVVYKTSTSTATVATATHYAACDVSNQLSHVSGNDIVQGIPISLSDLNIFAHTAYDCCAAAVQYGYGFSAFGFFEGGVPGCQLCFAGSCALNGTVGDFGTVRNGGKTYTLSNGYCGSWRYDGLAD
jgi:hypothetical protein